MNGFEYLIETLVAVSEQARPIASDAIRLVMASLFCISAWSKVRNPEATRSAIINFGLQNPPSISPYLLGTLEAGIALALVMTGWAGPLIALSFLGAMTGLVTSALIRGERFPCSCFAPSNHRISQFTVLRNTALILLALFVLIQQPYEPGGIKMLALPTACALIGIGILANTLRAVIIHSFDFQKLLERHST